MVALSGEIVSFFTKYGPVVVSTLDVQGAIHCAVKGIVDIKPSGISYLIDLYRGQTFKNITHNHTISITAIDEHQFRGYTLKGKAKIVFKKDIAAYVVERWEEIVAKRISQRVITNIQADRKTQYHPEARLPDLKYLIEMEVEEIVDLTPYNLRAQS